MYDKAHIVGLIKIIKKEYDNAHIVGVCCGPIIGVLILVIFKYYL